MHPLIEIQDLLLADKTNTIIVDVRAGADARQRYDQGHLEGAFYTNLDDDLAEHPADAAFGGRHPLPSPQAFATFLTSLGITSQTHIVVYDDKANAMGAARLWWMLRAIGHENVQVLNGGLKAAIDHGITLSTVTPLARQTELYPAPSAFKGTAGIEEVKLATGDDNRLVIDVREGARYMGHTEPIDLIAGHIPGAVNVPYASTNIDADSKYNTTEQLAESYKKAFGKVAPQNVIVHCGSGVTACHTLLAMDAAGIKGPKLYVGSWSEWSRRPDLPIAKENRY